MAESLDPAQAFSEILCLAADDPAITIARLNFNEALKITFKGKNFSSLQQQLTMVSVAAASELRVVNGEANYHFIELQIPLPHLGIIFLIFRGFQCN